MPTVEPPTLIWFPSINGHFSSQPAGAQSHTCGADVPGSLDLAKNISFLDWKLATAQNQFVDGHYLGYIIL
jgi:hypothetical protein